MIARATTKLLKLCAVHFIALISIEIISRNEAEAHKGLRS